MRYYPNANPNPNNLTCAVASAQVPKHDFRVIGTGPFGQQRLVASRSGSRPHAYRTLIYRSRGLSDGALFWTLCSKYCQYGANSVGRARWNRPRLVITTSVITVGLGLVLGCCTVIHHIQCFVITYGVITVGLGLGFRVIQLVPDDSTCMATGLAMTKCWRSVPH